MKIPSSFSLLGHKIIVRYKRMKGIDGEYHDDKKTIFLHSDLKKGPTSHHQQVFLHEAVHAFLIHMGRETLNDDDGFVDALANHIHQMILTAIVEKK